jgi:hypothetical protein
VDIKTIASGSLPQIVSIIVKDVLCCVQNNTILLILLLKQVRISCVTTIIVDITLLFKSMPQACWAYMMDIGEKTASHYSQNKKTTQRRRKCKIQSPRFNRRDETETTFQTISFSLEMYTTGIQRAVLLLLYDAYFNLQPAKQNHAARQHSHSHRRRNTQESCAELFALCICLDGRRRDLSFTVREV